MIRHEMDIQHNVTEYLYPGQLAFVAVDQPIFAVGKSTRWQWLEIYYANQIMVMFGGLHLNIENKRLVRQEPCVAQSKSDIFILGHNLVLIFILGHRRYDFYTELHLRHEDAFSTNPL